MLDDLELHTDEHGQTAVLTLSFTAPELTIQSVKTPDRNPALLHDLLTRESSVLTPEDWQRLDRHCTEGVERAKTVTCKAYADVRRVEVELWETSRRGALIPVVQLFPANSRQALVDDSAHIALAAENTVVAVERMILGVKGVTSDGHEIIGYTNNHLRTKKEALDWSDYTQRKRSLRRLLDIDLPGSTLYFNEKGGRMDLPWSDSSDHPVRQEVERRTGMRVTWCPELPPGQAVLVPDDSKAVLFESVPPRVIVNASGKIGMLTVAGPLVLDAGSVVHFAEQDPAV